MGKTPTRYFTKEDTEGNIQMRWCSTSLTVREMQAKTMMSWLYTPIKMAKIKILTIPNASENKN